MFLVYLAPAEEYQHCDNPIRKQCRYGTAARTGIASFSGKHLSRSIALENLKYVRPGEVESGQRGLICLHNHQCVSVFGVSRSEGYYQIGLNRGHVVPYVWWDASIQCH